MRTASAVDINQPGKGASAIDINQLGKGSFIEHMSKRSAYDVLGNESSQIHVFFSSE